MTSTNTTTSSNISTAACEDHKRSMDEAFINKMKGLVERLRIDNTTLKESLDVERSGVRTLKAQHEASIRNLKMEFKIKEDNLQKQARQNIKTEPNNNDSKNRSDIEIKKLKNEVQTLKAANKGLHEKIKVVQAAEMSRVAELRAQVARHAAIELASEKQARLTSRKLLEEIKSKERVLIQLQREMAKCISNRSEQAQKMEGRVLELSKKFCLDQDKDRNKNRGSLKTDIQHRKENLKRESPGSEGDSGTSSGPPSLSPQLLNDMWSCGQCKAAEARAQAASRECARLADALRDARDQLELMEFRILELEDAAPDKSPRDNLTDSDSGCVSPGSRIKDSASPELKRMDSGYKSPQNTPSSPCTPRRTTTNEEFKEDFAKAQVLAEVLDRNSEASDSLRSNPVKDHLELMILNAGSAEDRSCLEQVLVLLYNYQALSSSVSEEDFQIKPRRSSHKADEVPSKIQKAIATVSPYSQKGYKCELFESLDERKTVNVLQESGIFEEEATEAKATQTDANDTFECTGELNTEIQRLNSIREKLEKQGVRNRSLAVKEDVEGLECRCVKLGKKHKQYYERRLKFLEGKISIYEAAQDVKQAKLAERLQKEFILENRVQELESQILDLQDKYERLEEECCELEEIENDTRLHWQQLEVDYELCSAQLRDMTEERECSRAQAERLIAELTTRELTLKAREKDLLTRLSSLEKAVPALIVWNMMRVVGMKISLVGQRAILNRITPYNTNNKQALVPVAEPHLTCQVTTVWDNICFGETPGTASLRTQITNLLKEKQAVETKSESLKKNLEDKIQALEDNIEMLKRQLSAAESGAEMKKISLEKKIIDLEERIRNDKEKEKQPIDPHTTMKLRALLISEQELKTRVAELERREQAYLEMLTQADDMWAEMEGGYKKKIDNIQMVEAELTGKIKQLESERDEWKKCFEPLKRKLKEVEESESVLRVALDKSERDTRSLMAENDHLKTMVESAKCEQKKSETALQMLSNKFKKEQEHLRKLQRQATSDVAIQKETLKKTEQSYKTDLDTIRRELKVACKSAQELECNNSELKEEVESLEKQLSLTQKALSQCKRRCDEKIKTLSHEISIKTEELEELRSETMRQIRASRMELKPDRTEYIDEGYTISVPKKSFGRMHHSMNYITSESRCSCPTMRSHLVGQLIEDLFERIHKTTDDDLKRLCKDIVPANGRIEVTVETKAKITNYLLMAISKELVRSIGDADAKTDTEEWQRTASSITYSVPNFPASGKFASLRLEGNAGVLNGASRLASVSCACAAARLCAAAPELTDSVQVCQEEVLDNSDVKVMEEQLANAIESIVNCPSCALGSNAIVWSTDV